MSEPLADRLARASKRIDAGFGPAEMERGLATLEQRTATPRRLSLSMDMRMRVGFGMAAAALLLTIAWRAHDGSQRTASAPTERVYTTSDGSVAKPLDAQSLLAVKRDTADEVQLELERGRGHFEVTPKPERRYRVRAGAVTLEVLGTAFDVERIDGGARVHVDHGVVRVSWSGGEATLRAGDSGVYPPPTAADEPMLAPREDEPETAQAKRPQRDQAWRALARAGKHREAFGSLGKQSQPVEDLAGLLLAADAARLSGHPREAAGYLEHLVQRYPTSPSAPLAAFTLGRLSLYELKQPALAASSFARAYTLAPNGPMAEDALAREAEAYHQAGDAERSKSAVRRYVDRFPNGPRRAELARYLAP